MEKIKTLGTKEVAEILGINIQTAQKLFRTKGFPKIKGIKRNLVVEDVFYKYIRGEEYVLEEK